MTHGKFDRVEMARVADQVRNPVHMMPSVSPPTDPVQLISCDNDSVSILGAESTVNGKRMRICLVNNSELSISTLLRTRPGIKAAWISTPGGQLGEPLPVSGGELKLKLVPRRVSWFVLSQSIDNPLQTAGD